MVVLAMSAVTLDSFPISLACIANPCDTATNPDSTPRSPVTTAFDKGAVSVMTLFSTL